MTTETIFTAEARTIFSKKEQRSMLDFFGKGAANAKGKLMSLEDIDKAIATAVQSGYLPAI